MHIILFGSERGGGGGGGRRAAGKATQVHAGTRAGSVCETAGKLTKRGFGDGVGWFGCGGSEVTG